MEQRNKKRESTPTEVEMEKLLARANMGASRLQLESKIIARIADLDASKLNPRARAALLRVDARRHPLRKKPMLVRRRP